MCVDEETAGAGIRRIVDSWQPADLDFSIQNGVKSNLDSRVATALSHLGSPIEETIDGYLNCFCSLFSEIAAVCGVSGMEGLRKLDNALFSYGSDPSFPGD